MFACRFPKYFHLTSHAEALSLWESCKPAKGYSDPDWRSLFDRRRDNSIVRKDNKGRVHFRLYSTDVVTFNPDNTVDLDPVSTRSTCNFVDAILGRGVDAMWSDRSHPAPSMLTRVSGRVYHTPEFATLSYDTTLDSPKWVLLAGAKPMTQYRVDKAKAKQVLVSSGFNQFSLWLKTQSRMGVDPREGGRYSSDSIGPNQAACLDDLDSYPHIARGWSAYKTVDTQLAALRKEVYKYHGATAETEVLSVDYSEIDNLLASLRKYA